jgi:hypothetical protein
MTLGPDDLGVYLCDHVFDNTRPILYVSRSDGDWQFLCGGDHPAGAVPRVVGLAHILGRDPSIRELESLPDDWEAERMVVGGPWKRTPATA